MQINVITGHVCLGSSNQKFRDTSTRQENLSGTSRQNSFHEECVEYSAANFGRLQKYSMPQFMIVEEVKELLKGMMLNC